jgi:hypothetical protein
MRVKRLSILPGAKRRGDRQGAKKGKEGRGGGSGVLPRPLGDRSKHQTLAVAGSEGAGGE